MRLSRFFLFLTSRLPLHDFVALTCKPAQKVFVYQHKEKSVSLSSGNQIPWMLVFLLTHYHKQFRFISRKGPNPKEFISSVRHVSHKVAWKSFFKDQGPNSNFSKPLLKKAIAPFRQVSPPEIEYWISKWKAHMYSSWAQCSRFGPGVRTWANTFQIHLAAMACLDIFQLVALPTDKDGGFCLVHSGVLREVHLQLFRSSWYKEVASLYASESFWKDNVVPPFIGICKRICKVDPIPFKELTSSVNPLHTSSVLRNTVKTHKPNGQVKFRPVHASSKHCFSSASVCLPKNHGFQTQSLSTSYWEHR